MEDEHKRIHHRIAEVEQTVNQVHSLASSVERLAVSVEQMARTQKEHADQLEKLEGRDGEKVETGCWLCYYCSDRNSDRIRFQSDRNVEQKMLHYIYHKYGCKKVVKTDAR